MGTASRAESLTRVWIVNQDMQVPGGCCPDLPDSVYMTEEDAMARVKVLAERCEEGWKDLEIRRITDEPDDIEIEGPTHYHYRAYIVGSIPLLHPGETLEGF